MYERSLTKPDGRALTLYSRRPIPEGLQAPSPGTEPPGTKAHLRWHPLRGEWVAFASHRQNRTFLPPPEYHPLAPTTDPAHPTELPAGDYDVAVFENRFPTLTGRAEVPAPPSIVPTRPGKGACEVVVFTQDPSSSLGALPLDHLELLLEVWADRYRELGARPDVDYVMPFENRGVEVGVTLHHPHGQIYAYPFIPPIPARELAQQSAWFEEHGSGLLADLIVQALEDGKPHPEAHLHIEFYPAYRMPGRLKYLAGSEIGAGVFTADTLPEEKVQELRAVEVDLDPHPPAPSPVPGEGEEKP